MHCPPLCKRMMFKGQEQAIHGLAAAPPITQIHILGPQMRNINTLKQILVVSKIFHCELIEVSKIIYPSYIVYLHSAQANAK